MRTLFLHIGHAGAAGSALASCLARSRVGLARAGITYPRAPGAEDKAGPDLAIALRGGPGAALRRWSLAGRLRGSEDVVLTAPDLATGLSDGTAPQAIAAFADRCGFAAIRALLVIDDPVPDLLGAYQARIRTGHETGTLAEAARRFDAPVQALAALRLLSAPPFECVTVHARHLRAADPLAGGVGGVGDGVGAGIGGGGLLGGAGVPHLAQWLRVPPATLLPARPLTARALTATEVAIQRVLNARFGPRAAPLAAETCAAIPSPAHDPLCLSPGEVEALLARLSGAMAEVNDLIDPAHAYDLTNPAPLPAPGGTGTGAGSERAAPYRMERAHLRQIARQLAARVPGRKRNAHQHRDQSR